MATFNPSLFESYDDYMSIMDSMGLGQQTSGISLPTSLASMSPQEKAQVYNQLLSQGFSNADIRSAVEQQLGSQSNANWGALQDIASGLRASGTTGGGALQTAFGDTGSWQFGKGATYQDNMITSQGAYFQRGGDVVVSDELFWNPNSPTGDKLKAKVDQAKAQGQRAGVVITPYAVFQGKASNEQLINEIKNSGVDFVALDPYLGFGVPKDDLLNWTKDFIPQLNNLGLGVKLVTQDFAKAGMEQETRQYNQELMSLPGVSEFVSFGLEDAPDLQGSPEWVSLSAPTEQAAQATPKEPERKTAQEAPPSGAAEVVQQTIPSVPAATGMMAAAEDFNLGIERESGKAPVSNVPGRTLYAPTQQELQNTLANISSTASQEAMKSYGPNTLENFLTAAIAGTLTGGLLGPAGLGLSAPIAGAGAGAAGQAAIGGDLNQILKGALIGGLGAYGTGEVLNTMNQSAYDLSFAAADAAQLANQGLDAAAIAQNLSTYVDPTLAASLANTAANQAFALADATQLAQQGIKTDQIVQVLQASGVDATTAANMAGLAVDSVANPVIDASGKVVPPTINASDIVPDLKFQPQTRNPVQISTLPDSVTVTGQTIPGNLFDIAPSSVGGLLYDALELRGVSSPVPGAATQQVQVAGQNQAAQTTAPEAVGGALAAVTPQVPTQQAATQQVQVPGQTAANNVDPDTASAVLSNLLGQPVTVQGGTQSVDVTGRPVGQTITPEVAASLLSAAAGQQVVVQAPTVQPSVTAPETLGSVLSSVIPTTPPAPSVGQQVQVTGSNIPPAPPVAPEAAGGLLSSLITNQTVPVTGTNMGTTTTTPETVGSVVSALAPTQTVPVEDRSIQAQTTAPVIPVTPAEQVVVAGNRVVPVSEAVIPAGAVGAAAGVTAPKTTTDQSLFKPSDVLKLIGLLGGAGAGSALAGTGTGAGVGVPPSDTMLGSTTPQFGNDYYAAIQRYYNTYMPQTPRNVATPLQQWYENKFGA